MLPEKPRPADVPPLDQLGLFNFSRRRYQGRSVRCFRIFENLSFVVPDDYPLAVAAEHVFWIYGNLAAAARGVDDVLRNRIASGVPSKLFHYLQPFAHTRPQVSRAGD